MAPICHTIDEFMVNAIILRVSCAFSESGAKQLAIDVEATWSLIDRYAGSGQGTRSMRRLADALALLTLPVQRPGEIAEDDQVTVRVVNVTVPVPLCCAAGSTEPAVGVTLNVEPEIIDSVVTEYHPAVPKVRTDAALTVHGNPFRCVFIPHFCMPAIPQLFVC